LQQVLIPNMHKLIRYEESCVTNGYEGIMLRRADGMDIYKFGRSTINEFYLMKLKRFEDAEAVIIGFEEKMHNSNAVERNNLGDIQRSSAKIGMVPTGMLGALLVHSKKFGEFSMGTGFNDQQRIEIWNNRNEYKGLLAKYKYQKCGIKEKPRFPVFIGIRDSRDT